MNHKPHYNQPTTRRDMLRDCGVGFGMLAFAAMMGEQAEAEKKSSNPLVPRAPHFAPRAKRVIFIFMHGDLRR